MNVAGVSFKQNELKALMSSKNETVIFKAIIENEPTNSYDPNAKKVICNGYHIGYIPKDLTQIYSEKEYDVEIYWWKSKYMYMAKIII
jgi:hypothetical protein